MLNFLTLNLKEFNVFVLEALIVLMLIFIFFERKRVKKETQKKFGILDEKDGHKNFIIDIDTLFSWSNELHKFTMSATEIGTKENLAKGLIDLICRIVRSESGSVMFFDSKKNELKIAAIRGMSEPVIEHIKPKLQEIAQGRYIQSGKPIFIENIADKNNSQQCFIAVPMRFKERIQGFVSVNCPQKSKNLEEREMTLLSVLVDQAVLLFENIELYDNIQEFYLEIVQALARTIDAKDSYTYDHADRARKYARLICAKLNLPDHLTRQIEYAALVHDIGKIGIKEEILNKAGKLDHEEEEALRKHPQIGQRILEPVTFLAPVAPIVHYHHEWFNGEGYPEGLTGEQIPLGSRIVSVIDAYDAMTTDRPYRKASLQEEAIKELVQGKGTQFDPKVVEAFIKVLEEEKQKNQELKNK